jgi:excinuclease UvrABC nuclease subunit
VEASQALEFERAALLRDQIRELKAGGIPTTKTPPKKVDYRAAMKKPGKPRPKSGG